MQTVGEKLKFVERLRISVPVNKAAGLAVSKAWGWWNSTKGRDPLEFLSNRPQVVECPRLVGKPDGVVGLVGLEKGCVRIVGYIDPAEKLRLGWTGPGNLVIRCSCGRYEHRSTCKFLKPIKKEYGDACTACRNVWAEMVKSEFEKTGKWPVGGGPTHKASQFAVDCSV